MKYTVQVFIEKDRQTILDVMQDPDQFQYWMEGLQEYNILHKTENQVGTKTELVFKDVKGRVSTMVEIVESMDLPNEIVTSYEAGGVFNRCINRFDEKEDGTVYEMETIFKFGFFTNLFIWLFKPMFRSQTLKGMTALKRYVEEKE